MLVGLCVTKELASQKWGRKKKLLLKRKELNSTIVVPNIYCSYLKGYVNNVGPFMKRTVLLWKCDSFDYSTKKNMLCMVYLY